MFFWSLHLVLVGAWGSVVVKALRYYSDGPGIDPRWCHLGFFPWFLPTKPCSLRSTQPLKMSTRDFSWDKGGRCIWLTTYTLVVPKVEKIRGLNLPGSPNATSACCRTSLFLSFFTLYSLNRPTFRRNLLLHLRVNECVWMDAKASTQTPILSL